MALVSISIREFTQKKGPICTVNVGNLLSVALTFVVISEFTQENRLIAAVIQDIFLIINLFYSLKLHTGGRRYDCSDCGKSFISSIYLRVIRELTLRNGLMFQ